MVFGYRTIRLKRCLYKSLSRLIEFNEKYHRIFVANIDDTRAVTNSRTVHL